MSWLSLFNNMTWKDITVFQWQQLHDLKTKSDQLDDVDITVKAAAIVTNRTEKQVQEMTLLESKKLASDMAFLNSEIKINRVDYINANGNKYKVNYDIRRMPSARYIEAKHFASDFAGNIHRIAACMVTPMKWTMFGYEPLQYDATRHEQYAEDLQTAPITEVMGSVVFFYHVFKTWTKVFQDYLKQQMMAMGMTKYQAEVMYQALCDSLDGFTRLHLSLNTKGSHLNKSMT
jgi:hypothetical protein